MIQLTVASAADQDSWTPQCVSNVQFQFLPPSWTAGSPQPAGLYGNFPESLEHQMWLWPHCFHLWKPEMSQYLKEMKMSQQMDTVLYKYVHSTCIHNAPKWNKPNIHKQKKSKWLMINLIHALLLSNIKKEQNAVTCRTHGEIPKTHNAEWEKNRNMNTYHMVQIL
jgi:hypothetical protein